MSRSIFQKAKNVCHIKIELFIDNIKWGKFGKGSKITQPLKLSGKQRIFVGNHVNIYKNARIEAVHEWGGILLNGKIFIGDGTSIEQSCHIVAANEVVIGKACVFSAYVYVSDCSHQYEPEVGIKNNALNIKKVHIGEHCFIGIGSCIMPGATLGNNVVVGANSVVIGSIPDDSMIVGSPARIIKKWSYNSRRWESINNVGDA